MTNQFSTTSTTPIKRMIADVDFLILNQRYDTALTLLLVAVAASSSKMFPEGTSSIDNPAKKIGKTNPMGDREKFTRFLGGRIRNILNINAMMLEEGVELKRKWFSNHGNPEDVLYEQYRNPLIHEGELPGNIKFSPEFESVNNRCLLTISEQGIEFPSGHRLLNLLREVVINAPINGVEFGINHIKLIPNNNICINQFAEKLAVQLSSTFMRVSILMQITLEIGQKIQSLNDEEIKNEFSKNEYFKKCPVFGMSRSTIDIENPYFKDDNGQLTEHGLFAVRTILCNASFVNVSK